MVLQGRKGDAMADGRLLRADQLAARLGLRPSTIKRWGRRGKIPRLVIAYNTVRFVWGDVVKALRKADEAERARGGG